MAKIVGSNSASSRVDVSLNDYGTITILGRTAEQYDPSFVPSLYKFLSDLECDKKIIIGPYGSGKTSGIVNQLLCDSVMITPCDDGIRRSRWAIVRNTAAQLETTVLKSWNFWMEGLPTPYTNKRHYPTYLYNFNDEAGKIQMEVVFIPLDRIDDIRKLDSFELTGCFFNELRHIPKPIFDIMLRRIDRYPEKLNFIKLFEKKHPNIKDLAERNLLFRKWHPYISRIYADTNPPKVRHWIQELENQNLDPNNFEKPLAKIYHQPPALLQNKERKWILNPYADNLMFVGEDYYLNMIPSGEEFIKVYAQGKYGTVVDGKPVYQNYNDDLHSVDDLPINIYEPIYLGWDFGLVAPACILKQVVDGQIRAIKEFVVDCETVESVCQNYLIPFLNVYCKGMKLISTHDPANTSEGAQKLLKFSIESNGCRTNKVETRVSCTTSLLDRLKKGKPAYVISRRGCPVLREGFLGEYHYRRLKVVGDEKYVDSPNKVHPYSDIHDANQYVDILLCDEAGIKFNEDFNNSQYQDDSKKSKVTGY